MLSLIAANHLHFVKYGSGKINIVGEPMYEIWEVPNKINMGGLTKFYLLILSTPILKNKAYAYLIGKTFYFEVLKNISINCSIDLQMSLITGLLYLPTFLLCFFLNNWKGKNVTLL